MGNQKTQQAPEQIHKSREEHVAQPAQTVEPAEQSHDMLALSRLSSVGSPPPVPVNGLSHPTATANQAAIFRTLQRRQGNAFVQRAVVQGQSAEAIPERTVEQAQSDQSIDASTQSEMEPRLGGAFSRERISTDSRATDLVQDIPAQTFTRGQETNLEAGQYKSDTEQGPHMLTHEPTPSIQQEPLSATKMPSSQILSQPGNAQIPSATTKDTAHSLPEEPTSASTVASPETGISKEEATTNASTAPEISPIQKTPSSSTPLSSGSSASAVEPTGVIAPSNRGVGKKIGANGTDKSTTFSPITVSYAQSQIKDATSSAIESLSSEMTPLKESDRGSLTETVSIEVRALSAKLHSMALQRKTELSEVARNTKAKIAADSKSQKDAIHAQLLAEQNTIKGEIDLVRVALQSEANKQRTQIAAISDAGFTSLLQKTEGQINILDGTAERYKQKVKDSAAARRDNVNQFGNNEGKRGKAALDQQAQEAIKRGQAKANTYPADERGQAQAEAVQLIAQQVAVKLAEPGPDLEKKMIAIGKDLAKGLQGGENEIVNAIGNQNPQIGNQLFKQAHDLKDQFTLLASRANEGLDQFLTQTNTQLDAIENSIANEFQVIEIQVTSQIDNGISQMQSKVDSDVVVIMDIIDTLVATTNRTAENSKHSNADLVRSAFEDTEAQVGYIVEQATYGLDELASATQEQLSQGERNVIEGVTNISAHVSTSLTNIATAASDGVGTFSEKVQNGSDKLGEEWDKVLSKVQEQVEGEYEKSIAGWEKEMDNQVLKAQSQITIEVENAIRKNREPLDQLDANMETAAKEARDKYDAPWYKKFGRWVWSALKAIFWALVRLIVIVGIAVLAIIAIIVGIVFALLGNLPLGIFLIVVGLLVLLGLVVYIIWGILANIWQRIKSADTWWQAIWGFFVGVLDIVGIPRIIEGIIRHDIVNGRKLTIEEAGERFGQGLVDLLLSLTLILRLLKFLKVRGTPPPPERSVPPAVKEIPETKPGPAGGKEVTPSEKPAEPAPKPVIPPEYDPKAQTDPQLQLDKDPTPRPGETPEQAQRRAKAAETEINERELSGKMRIYDGLGKEPPELDIEANDAKNASNGAHTLERHGRQVPLRDGDAPAGERTVEGRILGKPPWPQKANFSYRWLSNRLLNRVVNAYLKANWDRIRSDLAEKGVHENPTIKAGEAVGEGFYNKNYGVPNALPEPIYHKTSLFLITIQLLPGEPPSFFVVRTYPAGTGP